MITVTNKYVYSDGTGTSANQLEAIEEDENEPSTTTKLRRVRITTFIQSTKVHMNCYCCCCCQPPPLPFYGPLSRTT